MLPLSGAICPRTSGGWQLIRSGWLDLGPAPTGRGGRRPAGWPCGSEHRPDPRPRPGCGTRVCFTAHCGCSRCKTGRKSKGQISAFGKVCYFPGQSRLRTLPQGHVRAISPARGHTHGPERTQCSEQPAVACGRQHRALRRWATHTHTPVAVNFRKGQAGEREACQGGGCRRHPSVGVTQRGRARPGEPAPTETAPRELQIPRAGISAMCTVSSATPHWGRHVCFLTDKSGKQLPCRAPADGGSGPGRGPLTAGSRPGHFRGCPWGRGGFH